MLSPSQDHVWPPALIYYEHETSCHISQEQTFAEASTDYTSAVSLAPKPSLLADSPTRPLLHNLTAQPGRLPPPPPGTPRVLLTKRVVCRRPPGHLHTSAEALFLTCTCLRHICSITFWELFSARGESETPDQPPPDGVPLSFSRLPWDQLSLHSHSVSLKQARSLPPQGLCTDCSQSTCSLPLWQNLHPASGVSTSLSGELSLLLLKEAGF